MNPALPSYYLNGEEPQIVGKRCTSLVLRHFYEDGKITDQVNVAYLRFEERWYRLYFECATVFWRLSEEPVAAENSELAYGLLLNNLSGMSAVVGQVLESIAYSASEFGDVEVVISFMNGKQLLFSYSCESDSTRLAV